MPDGLLLLNDVVILLLDARVLLLDARVPLLDVRVLLLDVRVLLLEGRLEILASVLEIRNELRHGGEQRSTLSTTGCPNQSGENRGRDSPCLLPCTRCQIARRPGVGQTSGSLTRLDENCQHKTSTASAQEEPQRAGETAPAGRSALEVTESREPRGEAEK